MSEENLKIGYVVEVKGLKISVKVYENKNGLIILNEGTIIKNVSVGSFVRIPKGFSSIIAKIEGEYIKKHQFRNANSFYNESQEIDRIIELSVIGIIENNEFKSGLIELPLIMSEVYILNEHYVKKIFQFSKDANGISIGSIIEYDDYNLTLDSNSLLASHIGIFGNTGSGKSNTLAKLYHEVFKVFSGSQCFAQSNFILIDFNGEYENTITTNQQNKKYYKLSTSNEDGDKININSDVLEDEDFWAILCEATEKTQRPFLSRAIRRYKKNLQYYMSIDTATSSNFKDKVILDIKQLFKEFFSNPYLFTQHFNVMIDMFNTVLESTLSIEDLLSVIEWHSTNNCIVINQNGKQYINTEDEFERNIVSRVENIINTEELKTINHYILFEYTIFFSYMYEISRNYINSEHISPMIKRFENRNRQLRKIFIIDNNTPRKLLEIYSLLDVNIQFKKLIPLVLCKYYYDEHKKKYSDGSPTSLHIIVDEAHNILCSTSERESKIWKDYRLETFEEIIKEGRKFGVFLTVSSQRPSDISDTIISQLHNYFIHRLVNTEDLKAIGRAVSFIDKYSYDMIPILPQGGCIFSGISANFPVLMQVQLLKKELQPKSATIELIKLWACEYSQE